MPAGRPHPPLTVERMRYARSEPFAVRHRSKYTGVCMQNAFKVGMFVLALSALSVAHAQNSDPAVSNSSITQPGSQGAPITRAYPGGNRAAGVQSFDAQPAPGVFVRSDVNNGVTTVHSSSTDTELRVVQGRANITVHHPADGSRILVDLPGGQVSLLKDGLYTFNAATNTVRVLHGEAEARNNARVTARREPRSRRRSRSRSLAMRNSGRSMPIRMSSPRT